MTTDLTSDREASDREAEAIDEWVALFENRDTLAYEYAALLRENGPSWDGWRPLNQAILRRWSMAGLRYIKTKAWKLAVPATSPAAEPT